MKKTIIFLSLILACGFSYADDASEDVPVTQVSEAFDMPNATNVYAGQDFVFHLRSNKTTGYSWELADPLDKDVIDLVGTDYKAPDTALVGAPGTEVWTFRAKKPGKATIAFKYVRPWEKDKAAAKKAVFHVIVKESAVSSGSSELRKGTADTVSGSVESIELSDVFKRPNPKMTVIADTGKRINFVIKPAAVIYGRGGVFYSARDIAVGEKVEVNYRVKSRTLNEAVSIKRLDK